jgi:hypothetical protein
MMRILIALVVVPAFAATPAPAPTPTPAPNSAKLTSVYNLAHVGAMLDVCAASAPGAPDAAKTKEITELSTRLSTIVKAMGGYYLDKELPVIYESTKAQMASDEKLRRHVHETHQDCGERALAGMRTYVTDNEAMIQDAIESRRRRAGAKPQAPTQ